MPRQLVGETALKIFCQVKKAACRGVHLVCSHGIMGKNQTKEYMFLTAQGKQEQQLPPGKLSWLQKRKKTFLFFPLQRLLYHLNVYIHIFWKLFYFLIIFKDVCLFLMWPIFKVFVEFVTILLVSGFTLLAWKHAGSQFPDQVLNLHPLHGEARSQPVDIQESPGKIF